MDEDLEFIERGEGVFLVSGSTGTRTWRSVDLDDPGWRNAKRLRLILESDPEKKRERRRIAKRSKKLLRTLKSPDAKSKDIFNKAKIDPKKRK
jgi:hypothetical protein